MTVSGTSVSSGTTVAALHPWRLDARRSQAVFRVLLATLSRPGQVERLPVDGIGAAIVPLALAGVDSTFAVSDDPEWEARVREATGASPVPVAQAGLVALCGEARPEAVLALRRGSALAPEDGAKAGLDCTSLGGTSGLTLELAGPGILGTTTLVVGGVDTPVFDALARANAAFPAGVDVWLIDGRGAVAAIPRSSTVQVVA